MNDTFWNYELLGNTVQDYGMALAVLIGLIIIFSIFQRLVLHRLEKLAKKTKTDIDDAFIQIFKTIKPPFYFFLAFFIGIRMLDFPVLVQKIIGAILIIWVIFLAVKAVQIFINYLFRKKLEQESDRGTKSAIGAINIIAKIILWSMGLLMILSNLGVNITSIIAGLGVGGIAIAFALQNILADLFSSFAIYFDKPFVVGDFIVIGNKSGTVEKIGIKTTRIRALQGEEVVVSNQELTSAQIQNFKKMKERRSAFTIGVIYDTPAEKLRKIPVIIGQIVDKVENARFDRTHFKEFADSSLNFEIVYYITSNDYKQYMDVQQNINFKIVDAFQGEGIEMAYPTQTLFINK
jgi:small-conductance mechanosensitive channel